MIPAKLKKLFVALSAAAAAVTITAAVQNSVRASAAFEDYTYYYDYDSDGDGSIDTYFYYQPDFSAKKARIVDIDCSSDKLVIPKSFENVGVYDYDTWEYKEYELVISEIRIPEDSYIMYYPSYTTLEITHGATYISPQTLGYYYNEYFDWDTYEWVSEKLPIDGLKVYCTKGTAGETYAKTNGFDYTLYGNIYKSSLTLSYTSATYTGSALKPVPTVKLDGKTLIKDKDYTVEYVGNTNAGTGKVYVSGIGNYRGKLGTTFTIKPKSASNAKIASVKQQTYTGKALKPALTVTLDGKTLKSGTDYTVAYSSNTNPGTASAAVTFKGNYSGSKKVTFKIALGAMKNVKAATASNTSIKLSWSSVGCDKYYIYRYDPKTNKFKLIKTTTATSYTDTGLSQMTRYVYRVKAGKTVSGKVQYNQSVQVEAYTNLSMPSKMKLAVRNKKITVSWSTNTKADGYIIERSTDFGEFKRVKKITNKKTSSWTNTGLSNDKYYTYRICSYRIINGKVYYSDYHYDYSYTAASRLNGATLKQHRSFKVYNRQGKNTTSYTYTLSDKDIKILKDFAAAHFTKSMTNEEKVRTTIEWINKNVKYARGSDWTQISSKSWVEAIFTYKKGQCAQYNGALTAMLAYIGYDVELVQGWRGTWNTNYWQHFWCELKVDGIVYVMETGNYGENGNWMYMMARYFETGGYIRNQVNK